MSHNAALMSVAMHLQCKSDTRQGLQAPRIWSSSCERAHALVTRQPLTGMYPKCRQSRCRRKGMSTMAILRIFQQKTKTKIVRTGTPVLRKVARNFVLWRPACSHGTNPVCRSGYS